MSEQKLQRRAFLRGLGTVVSLPVLESLLPSSALAATSTAAKQAPVRMAYFYVPNGVHMPAWTPAQDGAGYTLPYTLEPLKNVKDDLLVLTGLTHHNGEALGDGPGDHARAGSSFLTGCHPRKTAGSDIKVGISVDQYAAQFAGRNTRFASLELGCEHGAQAGNCDSGYSCAYSSSISWRSPTTPAAKEVDPRAVFDRLFGNGDADEMAENRTRRQLYRKSILDFVQDEAKSLERELNSKDRAKLDEYFTSVREIEHRITMAGKTQGPGDAQRPAGIPQDYAEHIRLMCDMLVLAFRSDLTRVATFMFANEGSNRSYRLINIPEGHHDLSHHQGNPEKQEKLRQINRFHMTQFAYFLEKLKSIREGERTLLDNSLIVYGSGICDGNAHNHDNLPCLLAGRGGGALKSGRHVTYTDGTPMTNLYLTMLDAMKVPVHSLGDSTGRLPELT